MKSISPETGSERNPIPQLINSEFELYIAMHSEFVKFHVSIYDFKGKFYSLRNFINYYWRK
jgi:hypothetical protein